MKSIKYLLFAIGLFCMGKANAQIASLSLDQNALDAFPEIDTIGSTYAFFVTINNTGTVPFTGVLSIGGAINGTAYTGDTISQPIYYVNTGVNDSIEAGRAVSRLIVITVSSPPFIAGSSGVVIWPIAVSTENHVPVQILDSISKTVTTITTGINELTERNLKVYMNGQQLIVENQGQYLLKSVGIYDVAGNLLKEQQLTVSGVVNMDQYATGVYFAGIVFADDTRAVVKIVNSR